MAKDILGHFDIEVTPIDKGDDSMSVTFPHVDQHLKKLGLPYVSYDEMIEKIVREIKDRKKYVL